MFEYAVCQAVTSPPTDYVLEICPDQYVGLLHEFETGLNDFPCRKQADTDCFCGKRAILILESPHKQEFFSPFGPAKGATGRLVRQHLRAILANYGSTDFGLFLVNAIQNQCSLGLSPKKYSYRDAVFLKAWQLYGRNDFIRRLSALTGNHQVFVINACTMGKINGQQLSRRELVEDAIFEAINRESDIRITHPASWASPRNRSSTW